MPPGWSHDGLVPPRTPSAPLVQRLVMFGAPCHWVSSNEVYWPTIDRPQIRDLQFLVTDGETFFHDERRHLTTTTEIIDPDALRLCVTKAPPLTTSQGSGRQ